MLQLQDMMKETLQKLDRPLHDLDDVRDVMAVLKFIRYISQFKDNYFTEMWSCSEEGSYVRLIDVCITQL